MRFLEPRNFDMGPIDILFTVNISDELELVAHKSPT